MKYRWKRFWCPRGGKISLSDGGFLTDPEGQYAKWYQPDVVSFEQIANYPCLVLLGEPGIGKSHAIDDLYKETAQSIQGSADRLRFINLNEYGDESRLIRDLFENQDYADWENGIHALHLFIDSLDECRLLVPNVAAIFKSRFSRIETELKRLKLRIACRTLDWPESLEQSLPELWGKENYRAYELVPLRRKDVETAAEVEQLDTKAFFPEIERTATVPLAIKPVTLNFLISEFRRNGRLLKTRWDLYESGLLDLCDEKNLYRKDLRNHGGTGKLSPIDRLNVASRLAAVSIFCCRPLFVTELIADSTTVDGIAVQQLCHGKETILSDNLILDADCIREVLGTGLFSARGISKVGFVQQSYAEFLAARYLKLHGLSFDKTLRLLCHPADPEERVIPQLYETVAWIASQDKEVFNTLIRRDPQVLLRADEGIIKEEGRVAIVDALLESLHNCRDNDRDHDLYRLFSKLAHPGIARQLEPWITNPGRHIMARNVAIDIAEACQVKEIQTALADLALNNQEPVHLRSNAAHAVGLIGDDETKKRLIPIAIGNHENDPYDDLKGNALNAVWPGQITAEELFGSLTLPKRGNYIGHYWSFIEHDIVKNLQPKGIPSALRWIKANITLVQDALRFDDLVNDAILLAWEHMDVPEILDALAEAGIVFYKNFHGFPIKRGSEERQPTIFDDPGKRRLLAKTIIEKAIGTEIWHGLVLKKPRVIRPDDFQWCADQLVAAISKPAELLWAKIVLHLFGLPNYTSEQMDIVLELRSRSSHFKSLSDSFFMPTLLDSKEARDLKRSYERMVKGRVKSPPKKLSPSPEERIEICLKRFETGDLEAWWLLMRELTHDEASTHYRSLIELDITKEPGWINAKTETRSRIMDAAATYLMACPSYEKELLYNKTAGEKTSSAYKAFLILLNERPESLDAFEFEVWSHWVALLFGPFGHGEEGSDRERLLAVAYEKAPDCILGVTAEIFRLQLQRDSSIGVLDDVDCIWDRRMADLVFNLLNEAEAKPSCWAMAIEMLVKKGDRRGIEMAITKLAPPFPSAPIARELAIHSGAILIKHTPDAGWPIIWPIIKDDPILGRELISAAAWYLDHETGIFAVKLNEMQLAEFYIWLVQAFPPPNEGSVRDFRNKLINILENAGSFDACRAIEHIAGIFPGHEWIKSVLVDARRHTSRQTWVPLRHEDFIAFITEPKTALVRTPDELQDFLIKMLSDLEQKLQGQSPAVYDLWDMNSKDKRKGRPKDENHFSDWVKRNIDSDLSNRGMVVAREVEIRPGEKTDIHVTAVIPGIAEGCHDQIRVIIETKGCWHRQLKISMKTQLVERYLFKNQCKHGIYLVGWYPCNSWDKADYRKGDTPKWSLEKARGFFESQAQTLSSAGLRVQSAVIDCAIPEKPKSRPPGKSRGRAAGSKA